MARSNGPATPTGWPPGARPVGSEQEPAARPQRQPHLIQPAQPQGQQHPAAYPQGYAQPPQYDPRTAHGLGGYDDAPGAGDYGQPPYQQPRADAGGYLAPAYAPRQGAPSYAPQFDPYVPPPPQQQGYRQPQPGYPAQPGYEPANAPRPAAYQPDMALSQLNAGRGRTAAGDFQLPVPPSGDQQGQAYDPRGYEPQWPAPQQLQPQPQAYDLGGYQPADPRQGYAQEPGFAAPAAYDNARHPGRDPAPYYDPQQGFAQPDLDMHGTAGQQAYADHRQGTYDQAGYEQGAYDQTQADAGEHDEYADDDEEYEDEPRKGKLLYVMGALVLAVMVGGGLAYGYQKFFNNRSTQLATPVIKGDASPTKVKPAEPGGRQFANADSKMMDRLSSSGSTSSISSENGSDGDGGPVRVKTVTITRDGSIAPPPAMPASPPATASVSVPGLTIVDGLGPRPSPRAEAPAQPPRQPIVVSPPAAPAKPVIVARAAPAKDHATDVGAMSAAPTKQVKPAAVAALPKTMVPRKAPATGRATGAGYVVVLASVPVSPSSRTDSLAQFANMQQKFGTILQGKTPDVQEADLGAKGKYHRLLVGPPSSREQASGVCTQLKAAGYASCWVLGY